MGHFIWYPTIRTRKGKEQIESTNPPELRTDWNKKKLKTDWKERNVDERKGMAMKGKNLDASTKPANDG